MRAEQNDLVASGVLLVCQDDLTDSLQKLLNAERLQLLKPSAYIINTARGGLIDHGALYEALKHKRIAGAALDAFEEEPLGETPLRGLDNCWLSPHAAGSTRDARARSKQVAAENVIRFFRGDRPLHIINPEVLTGG